MRKVKFGSRFFDMMNIIFMVLFMFIILYPLYYIFIVSISGGVAVRSGQVKWFPLDVNLNAYKQIFEDPDIVRSYGNTLLYTAVGTAINLVMTTLLAYPLSKKQFYGRGPITVLVVLTMFFNGGMIPSYLIINSLGMIDTIWALVLPVAINSYNMILMRTFFQGLPEELFESARIDGSTELRSMVQIALPASLPVLSTMFLFYAVEHWNSFFPALIYLNNKAMYPVQVILRNIVIAGEMAEQKAAFQGNVNYVVALGIKYAVIIVVILPILSVYPFIQRYFIKGVMIGSLKE